MKREDILKVLEEANRASSNFTDKQLNYFSNKFGTKRDISSVKKSVKGTKETRWQQTLSKISFEDIINAQDKHGNHQNNTIAELGISYRVYKKLCVYYGIEKKKSVFEKSEFVRTTQSKPILVYSENNEFIKEYYSVSNVCKELKLHKGNMLSNIKKNRLYKGYYFKYKDTI
jgi:hypothetical protein